MLSEIDSQQKWETLMNVTGTACSIATLVVAASATTSNAETLRVSTRDELQQAAARAKPGDEIRVAPGNYRGGFSLSKLRGEKGKPIVIAAADPKNAPVFEGGGSCLQLSNVEHLELRDLALKKGRVNGLNIDDGGSFESPSRHVVVKRLVVADVGDRGNHDGIKLSGVEDFRIEACTVERWGLNGSGINMVGCRRGVVEGCTFRGRGGGGGNGVQTKGGSSKIAVQRCRFENAGGRGVNIGGSTGLQYFRPKPQGNEAKNVVVEDCTFTGSMAAVAFVGVDGAVVRNNTIYRPQGWLLRILQENRSEGFAPCRNGRFEHNIVLFRSDELRTAVNIGPGTSPDTFRFTGNWWHCIDRPQATRRLVRLPTTETRGEYGRDPQLRDPAKNDLRLKTGSPAEKYGPRPPTR